jgi:hypothetical protein
VCLRCGGDIVILYIVALFAYTRVQRWRASFQLYPTKSMSLNLYFNLRWPCVRYVHPSRYAFVLVVTRCCPKKRHGGKDPGPRLDSASCCVSVALPSFPLSLALSTPSSFRCNPSPCARRSLLSPSSPVLAGAAIPSTYTVLHDATRHLIICAHPTALLLYPCLYTI